LTINKTCRYSPDQEFPENVDSYLGREYVLPVDFSCHDVVKSALTPLYCLSCHQSSHFRIFFNYT